MKKVAIAAIVVLFFASSFWLLFKTNQVSFKEKSNTPSQNQSLQSDSGGSTRLPYAVSSFYPENAQELKTIIDSFLNSAEAKEVQGEKRILIVPHAGLDYSGKVAASGFKHLEGESNLRVIILGPSHSSLYDYAAVDNDKYWQTPLGKVEVDGDFVDTLVNGQSIKVDNGVHQKEHSLEMELIFLQETISNFKIVPILLSHPSDELISLLAQKLAYNFDENTILVVSSDLSHYPDWETANITDNEVVDSILTGKKDAFEQKLNEISSKNYNNLETSACGQDPIKVALELSELLGINNFEKIMYQNSGDVTGDKERVVGYASILGLSENISYSPLELSEDAKKEALQIARKAIEDYLSVGKFIETPPASKELDTPLGIFVTLTEGGQLRGCIGEFEPIKPLYKVIQDTAISSAVKDKRFAPVSFNEMQNIDVEVSVMTPRRKLGSWQEIRLGKDGVVVQKGSNAGTFLPQVATDNNWNLEKFLSELCAQKAGLSANCYKDPSVNIYVFEVQIFDESELLK